MSDRKILIAGLVSDEYTVSINFTTTIIRLQQRIASHGQYACPVSFEFFRHMDDAVAFFEKNRELTRLVVIDSGMSSDVDFILYPHEHDVVVPAYPMRGIVWDKVGTYLDTTPTPTPDGAKTAGLEYNFKPAQSGGVLDRGKYLEAHGPQAKILSISRDAIGTIGKSYDPKSCKLDSVCMIDVTAKCVNSGPYDFSGCVGTRFVVNSPSHPQSNDDHVVTTN